MTIDPSADAEAAARTMSARPDVEYAQPAYLVHTDFVPNDTFYSRQWNLPAIDMERAWDIQPAAGSNITVAVLDTGVAFTNVTMKYHADSFQMDGVTYPALGDLTLPFVAATDLGPSSRFVSPHDFIWNTNLPLDLDGHGTHVSGTIGQTTNNNAGTAGVAFNVKIMPVKVIDSAWDDIFGAPHQGTDDVVAEGVRYAADNGAKVINMSIGRTGPPAPAVEDAINYAVGKGVFVAIAAGNDENGDVPTTGGDPEMIAEIAVAREGRGVRGGGRPATRRARPYSEHRLPTSRSPRRADRSAGFHPRAASCSRRSTSTWSRRSRLRDPADLVAPRFDALAYYFFIGTSQATPHVSGVAAMLMQQGITSPAAVEAGAREFATDRRHGRPRQRVRLRRNQCAEYAARAGPREMKTILAVMAALSVAAPARARRHVRRSGPSLRGFYLVAEEQFAAKSTFDAAFSSSLGTFLGGGGQAVFRDGVYVDLSASRFQKTGQRAFFNGGQSFRLGTPLTATLTPIEGERRASFRSRRHRTRSSRSSRRASASTTTRRRQPARIPARTPTRPTPATS